MIRWAAGVGLRIRLSDDFVQGHGCLAVCLAGSAVVQHCPYPSISPRSLHVRTRFNTQGSGSRDTGIGLRPALLELQNIFESGDSKQRLHETRRMADTDGGTSPFGDPPHIHE